VLENVASPSNPRRPKSGALRTVSLTYWLLPLVGIVLVLWASYAATTGRRFSSANGVSGELLPGHSVGQSFVARYQNLSGVEVNIGTYREGGGPLRASLVLHLRRGALPDGPTKTPPIASEELATVRLQAGEAVGVNPWYLFSFPPIAGSQDQAFYVEIESPDGTPGNSVTLFWWLPTDEDGDPYPYGSAYLNGVPHSGDLAFGLHYSPSPQDAWAQLARAASVNLPSGLMVSMLVAVILGVMWVVLRLPMILRRPARRSFWLKRWSLPLVLLVALLNGILYLSMVPAWQGPDEHSHFAYAALMDRLDLDDRRVQAPDVRTAAEVEKLQAALATSMDRNQFTRYVAWDAAPGGSVGPNPSILQELRQPPAYYWLCAAALRVARQFGISADPYSDPEGALRVMRGVSLLLSLGLVLIAWVSAAFIQRGRYPWLRLLLPLGVALFPMRVFVDTTVNNDVLAELAVSALFAVVTALLRWPMGWRGVALAILAVALTAAGSQTKATASAASAPLLALSLLVWLSISVTRLVARRRDARHSGRVYPASPPPRWQLRAIVVPFVIAALLLLTGSGLFISSFQRGNEAVGWFTGFSPLQRVNRVASSSAHDGSYVIELSGQNAPNGSTNSVSQALLSLAHHPSMSLTISGWIRLSPGAAASGPTGPTEVQLSIQEGSRVAGSSEVSVAGTGEWLPISVNARLFDSFEQVLMIITAVGDGSSAPAASVQIDHFALKVVLPQDYPQEPASRPVLVNPSAEEAAVSMSAGAGRFLPSEARQLGEVLANPQIFDKGALSRYYADMELRSFWGIFGWVSVPLPEALYTCVQLLLLLALGGLLYAGIRRSGRWSYSEWLGLTSVGALAGAVSVGFAKQMLALATLSSAAYPQGRYLFVLIVPVLWLLAAGWGEIWSLLGGLAKRVSVGKLNANLRVSHTSGDAALSAASPTLFPLGAWLLVVGCGLFNLYCLLALVAPYYYG
jgi:hypothetical protein